MTITTSVVGDAIAHMESRLGDTVTLQSVCEEVGVGPRTLQKAFRSQLGTTPMTWLRHRRLAEARRQLSSADRSSTTVTAVATGLGITHLGRFAVEYHRMFGVPPSRTLALPPAP